MHLGPGGNSAHERAALGSLSNRIDFWDQPKLRGDACTFRNLVSACAEKFDSKEYAGIITHSFSGEIAQNMIGRTQRPIDELILVAPIRDLSVGFANLAESLGVGAAEVQTLRGLIQSRKSLASSPAEVGAFWQVVQKILSEPRYYRAFWAREEKLLEFEALAPKLPALDGEMWQTALSDFLTNRQAPQAPNCLRTVILGENDNYYSSFLKEKTHWESLGWRVQTCAQAGHFPHLEADALKFLSP